MLEHFSTKKTEAASSETLVLTYQNIWRQVPDDSNINWGKACLASSHTEKYILTITGFLDFVHRPEL
jgi:hypothetical protein